MLTPGEALGEVGLGETGRVCGRVGGGEIARGLLACECLFEVSTDLGRVCDTEGFFLTCGDCDRLRSWVTC